MILIFFIATVIWIAGTIYAYTLVRDDRHKKEAKYDSDEWTNWKRVKWVTICLLFWYAALTVWGLCWLGESANKKASW